MNIAYLPPLAKSSPRMIPAPLILCRAIIFGWRVSSIRIWEGRGKAYCFCAIVEDKDVAI